MPYGNLRWSDGGDDTDGCDDQRSRRRLASDAPRNGYVFLRKLQRRIEGAEGGDDRKQQT